VYIPYLPLRSSVPKVGSFLLSPLPNPLPFANAMDPAHGVPGYSVFPLRCGLKGIAVDFRRPRSVGPVIPVITSSFFSRGKAVPKAVGIRGVIASLLAWASISSFF
jgi:hypothetical protein